MSKEINFARYSRQIFIDDIGVAGQRKIMSARVLVVGLGGLGSPVLQYLAAAGLGHIGLMDFDQVEWHNLNRQILHRETSVGMLKTDSALENLSRLNSQVQYQVFRERFDADQAAGRIRDFDILVDASDNFTTRYALNDACLKQGKPLVYGSVQAYQGQLAVFHLNGSRHLRHLFPNEPGPEDQANCDSNGVLGPLPGIIGSMMAMEVLKVVLGRSDMANRLLLVDTMPWRFSILDY